MNDYDYMVDAMRAGTSAREIMDHILARRHRRAHELASRYPVLATCQSYVEFEFRREAFPELRDLDFVTSAEMYDALNGSKA